MEMEKGATPTAKGRILIVEDELIVAKDLQKTLEALGYEIVGRTDSGKETLRKTRDLAPDLVLMDIVLKGGRDGIETARELRERGNIPVIFLTAYGDPETLERVQSVSPFGYILKPYEERELATAIAVALVRHRLEKALFASEERFRMLAEMAPAGIYLSSPEGDYRYVNRAWCAMAGLSQESALGRGWLSAVHPEDRERMPVSGEKTTGERRPWAGEYRFIRPDGRETWVYGRAAAIQDAAGGLVGYVGINMDMTERKLSEAVLRENEQRLRLFYEEFPLGYQSLDEEGRFLEVNPAWLEQLGYDREEVIGKWFGDFLAPGQAEHFLKNFPCFKALGAIEGVEFELVRKDGSPLNVAFSGKISHDGQGRFKQTHCIMQDISERYRLERQLRQAQKMESIGTLAGGIAHDFNNILGAVMGYTEVALMDTRAGDPIRDSLEQIRKATFRARDLTKQILTFSRQGEQELKSIRLGLLIKEALKLLRASIPTTIEIRQEIRAKETWILGDPTQIHQVLMNLCTNALQAMAGRPGLLEIGLERIELDGSNLPRYPGLIPGPHLHLTISDNGAGIDSRIIDRIFDPFFTTKGLGEGTGMGLSVVHGIIKNHRGLVTVYSEKGTGTSFHIYFPSLQEGSGIEMPDSGALPTGKEHILLVDDEEFLINVGRQMLERLGYRVTSRSSGFEALELFQAQADRFDLVITDQTMPRMTGLELARELLALRPELPIVLCTGFSEGLTAERAKSIGIRDFLMKPIVLRDLAQKIRMVLDGAAAAE
jgi:two-component system cell cycle sensor histidine kinase/response regulator CckA